MSDSLVNSPPRSESVKNSPLSAALAPRFLDHELTECSLGLLTQCESLRKPVASGDFHTLYHDSLINDTTHTVCIIAALGKKDAPQGKQQLCVLT